MPLVTLATCNLDQWSLDFKGNTKRILESIEQAKRLGATYRVGPELEITGYGCEDHFLEMDTFLHAWDCIIEILKTDATVRSDARGQPIRSTCSVSIAANAAVTDR